MIDADQYAFQLLTRDAADLTPRPTIAADMDIDTITELPFWAYTLTGDGQISNGPGLWTFQLTMSVFAEGRDATFQSASAAYDLAHGWDERPEFTVLNIEGTDVWVSSLDDVDVFSRTASADVDGRNVVQFTGTFALALRANQ